MAKKIEVKIFNQNFEISSSHLEEDKLRELAQLVDEQMRQTFKVTNLSSALKVAVLTALNFAEEIAYLKESQNTITDIKVIEKIMDISKKIERLSFLLEEINE